MKKCLTCGSPLWISWLLLGMPWQKRYKSLKQAVDCVDLLPLKIINTLFGLKKK